MFHKLFTTLGRAYSFLISLIVSAILVVATWMFWGFYQDVMLQKKFAEEGQLRTVTITQAEYGQRSWRDILSNNAYLTFRDHGKTYTTRYVMGPDYVGSGDQVRLFYHPAYDSFKQPLPETHPTPSIRESRLVRWNVISTLSHENQLLLLCVVLATVSFFMVSGLIVSIVPIKFLQDIARVLVVLILLVVSVYFTYETYQYFQYYQHLKTNGHEVTVQVLTTDRHRKWHNSHSRHDLIGPVYRYQATVLYQRQKRIIAISQSDFETLKPGATLRTLYDESLNDLMSVGYPLDHWFLVVPVFFWVITLVLMRTGFVSRPKKQATVPR
jgi:hypothetical protein